MLKKVILLMTLLVLTCSISYAQTSSNTNPSSTGSFVLKDSTVTIPFKFIKLANAKMIEREYLVKINNENDSIIKLQKLYIANQYTIINDFQHRLSKANDINSQVNDNLIKETNKKNIYKTVSICGIVSTLLLILFK